MVIPYYQPLEQRTDDANVYLLAMCYNVKFHDSTNSDSETWISLIIDSSASISISLHLEDFVTKICASCPITLQGIGGGCEVEGIGTVTYYIPCLHKLDFTLQIENTLYVPSCPSCLLCPQQLHEQSVLKGPNNANFVTHAQGASLTHEGEHFDFPFHPKTKLPVLTAFHHLAMHHRTTSHSSKPRRLTHSAHQANPDDETISLMDPNDLLPTPMWRPTPDSCQAAPLNLDAPCSIDIEKIPSNLTHSQRELLDWHYKLGHQDIWIIKKMILHKVIPMALACLAQIKEIPNTLHASKARLANAHTMSNKALLVIHMINQVSVYL